MERGGGCREGESKRGRQTGKERARASAECGGRESEGVREGGIVCARTKVSVRDTVSLHMHALYAF